MHRAEVRIPIEGDMASRVAESLRPELMAEVEDTTIEMDVEGDALLLTLASKEASGLRAALNSYARLAMVAMDITQRK